MNEEPDLRFITPYKETYIGWKCELVKNQKCPVCRIDHESPQNFIIITEQGYKMIGCYVDKIRNFYPNPPWIVTSIREDYLIKNAKFDKIEPIFEDSKLNTLVFDTFKMNVTTPIAKVIFHMGKDMFKIDKDCKWWYKSKRATHWKRSDTQMANFCKNEVVEVFLKAREWYLENTSDRMKADCRIEYIDIIIRRLYNDTTDIVEDAMSKFFSGSVKFLTLRRSYGFFNAFKIANSSSKNSSDFRK